jgi:hypothetical protein
MIHRTRANAYSFQRGNKNYTLHPLREVDTSSSKHDEVNGFLTAAKFEAESQDKGVTYALVCKVGKKVPAFKLDEIRLISNKKKNQGFLVEAKFFFQPRGTNAGASKPKAKKAP